MNFVYKAFVNLSYTLQLSKSYQGLKSFFYAILEDDTYPYKKYFDYFMMLLILSSVMLLIRGVKYELPPIAYYFNDYIISMVFLIEYLLRFWVHSSLSEQIIHQYEKDEFLGYKFRFFKALGKTIGFKWHYIRSPYAIIDLLAIMPFFHELRILRLFILFRAFKIFRYTKSLHQFAQVLGSKKFEFFTLMIFASVMISVSAVLIYIAEANNKDSAINTMFEALYWSFVTLSTVGYGDFVPVTDLGRSVAMVIIISGVAVIAFMTSIVVSAFTEQLDGIKEQKMISDIAKMKRFYLVCGYNEISKIVCKRLQEDKIPFIIFENDENKFLKAVKAKFRVLNINPASEDSYKEYNIDIKEQVISVLCLEDTDIQNIYIALTLGSLNENISILSYLHEKQNRKKLSLAGVQQIIYPQKLVGIFSKEFVDKPFCLETISQLESVNTSSIFEEILIDQRIYELRKNVSDLKLHDTKLVFIGVYRDENFMFKPKADEPLFIGDVLIVIGLKEMIKEYSLNLHKAMR
ncbi:ion transporter [Sulfurimonas sp. MAG313]|nr:ion transporter [Sulfurimonas sp. MAG313]MDF1879971.1 ion transporter [Sulfurimonas sp. MAG313]